MISFPRRRRLRACSLRRPIVIFVTIERFIHLRICIFRLHRHLLHPFHRSRSRGTSRRSASSSRRARRRARFVSRLLHRRPLHRRRLGARLPPVSVRLTRHLDDTNSIARDFVVHESHSFPIVLVAISDSPSRVRVVVLPTPTNRIVNVPPRSRIGSFRRIRVSLLEQRASVCLHVRAFDDPRSGWWLFFLKQTRTGRCASSSTASTSAGTNTACDHSSSSSSSCFFRNAARVRSSVSGKTSTPMTNFWFTKGHRHRI